MLAFMRHTPHRTLAAAFGALLALAPLAIAQDAPDAIGSTKNSRAAQPQRLVTAGGAKAPLTYFAGEMSDEMLKEALTAAPGVRVVRGVTRESAVERAGEIDAIDAHLLTPELLEKATKLAWVQSRSAGVERFLAIKGFAENDRIVFTNMRGAHGPAIADHAFAMLLTLSRDLRAYDKAQEKGEWMRDGVPTTPGAPDIRPFALQGRTMLVVGLGGIGAEVAQRAHGFGMRVIGTRRTDTPGPAWIEKVGKPEDLLAMLPGADVVAICVPLTPETDKLFNEQAFAAMKQGAILINVARGRVVDTDAMLAALRSGRLAGACLDVTDPEPLPAGHALWKEPNVVITPHISADADLTDERSMALLKENLRRFDRDEPLLNVVDKKAGY